MSYDETHAGRLKDIKAISSRLNSIVNADNAIAHNCIVRDKYLGSTISAAQSAAIRNGTFRDIYLSDYWISTIPAYSWTDSDGTVHQESASSAAIAWNIYGCNAFNLKPNNNVGVPGNHVVVMSRGGLPTNRMNPTASTEGGYVNSEAFKNIIPQWEGLIKAVFGEDHVMPHWDYLCNAVTDGVETGYAYYENRLCDLPSMEMVFGFPNPNKRDFAGNMMQFPLFALRPEFAVAGGTHFWLRDVSGASTFRGINYNGGIAALMANNMSYAKFTPFFLLH